MSIGELNAKAGDLLNSRLRVPSHVVYRAFAQETVILNLETRLYHGVNPVGGRMLEVIDKANSVADAAVLLAGEYGVPLREIQEDLVGFCGELVERGLLVVERVTDVHGGL